MHCFILLVVYNDTISFAKAKKQHIDNIAEKVSSSGGANKLRALLVSTYDAFVDSNEDTIINSNGDTITSINVNMAVAAEIEAGCVCVWTVLPVLVQKRMITVPVMALLLIFSK